MKFKAIVCVLFSMLLMTAPVLGQSGFGSEKDLTKKADRLFTDGDYEKAMPLYSDLVSNYPDNYHYNYCYGICILFAGDMKPRAIPFLERAAEISITTDYVFYYLAKAYAYASRYEDAIKAFKDFKDVVNEVEAEKYLINLEISNCEYAALNTEQDPYGKIVDKTQILTEQVIDKSSVSPKNGKYILLPKKYLPKVVTTPDTKYAFLTASGNIMYYTIDSYKSGKEIVKLERKGNGQWGKPERLPSGINTDFDEGFPVCAESEHELYFSSNGHQGFGGRDIYKATYDPVMDVWSKPENLGHPINSVYHDYFFSIDAEQKSAIFASDRHSKPGVTTMYDVTFKSASDDAFINVTGSFIHNGEDDGTRAIIRIIDEDGKEVYATSTHPISGEYNLHLPAFGEYSVVVDRNGFETEERGLSLAMGTPRAFDQEIVFKKMDNGDQRLFINNMFDASGEFTVVTETIRASSKEGTVAEIGSDFAKDDSTEFMNIPIIRPKSKTTTDNIERSEDEGSGEAIASNSAVINNANESALAHKELIADTYGESIDAEGIVFRIQIGSFEDASEEMLTKYYTDRSIQDIRFYNAEDGHLKVITGSSRSFRGILSQLRRVKDMDCGDAFPVAFYNGKEISVLQAKDWIRKGK